jgi:hypothetical protein
MHVLETILAYNHKDIKDYFIMYKRVVKMT